MSRSPIRTPTVDEPVSIFFLNLLFRFFSFRHVVSHKHTSLSSRNPDVKQNRCKPGCSLTTPAAAATMPFPIVHINGFPGIGKLAIARKLVDLLKPFDGKLVHNHLMIDPAGAVLPRSSSDYQPLRRAIRAAVFDTLAKSPDTFGSVFVFTDFQSNDDIGRSVVAEYRSTAIRRNCTLVPVVLTCSKEENLRRLGTTERSIHGKLTDSELVSYIRDTVEVHRLPDNPLEMELDVTIMDADAAARLIYTHVLNVCVELNPGFGEQTENSA